jgi:hypothetical protein
VPEGRNGGIERQLPSEAVGTEPPAAWQINTFGLQ